MLISCFMNTESMLGSTKLVAVLAIVARCANMLHFNVVSHVSCVVCWLVWSHSVHSHKPEEFFHILDWMSSTNKFTHVIDDNKFQLIRFISTFIKQNSSSQYITISLGHGFFYCAFWMHFLLDMFCCRYNKNILGVEYA